MDEVVLVNEGLAAEVLRLTGAATATVAVDTALRAFILTERLRHDAEAYRLTPPTEEERAFANVPHNWADIADDTDWEEMFRC